MFCKNCGSKLEEGSKFCGSCGAAVEAVAGTPTSAPTENVAAEPATTVPVDNPVVESTAAPVATSADAMADTPVTEPPMAPVQNTTGEKKPLSKEALIGIIAGAAVLLVAILLVIILIPRGGGDNGGGSSDNGGTSDNGGSSNGGSEQKDAGMFTVSVPKDLLFSYEVDDDGDESLYFRFDYDHEEYEKYDDLEFYLVIGLHDISKYSESQIENANKFAIENYGATTNTLQGVELLTWNEDHGYGTKEACGLYRPTDNKWEYDISVRVYGESEYYTEGLETTLFEKYVPTIVKSIKKK